MKIGKIIVWILIAVVAVLAVVISLTIGWRPFLGPRVRPLTSRKFEATPQRLERGRYIFSSAAGCVDCHSGHDTAQKDHPVLANMQGAGQVMPFDDLPGRVVAPNLTPDPETGSGNWSDDQLSRGI